MSVSCTSCGRTSLQYTKFECPRDSKTVMYRCRSCKENENLYRCAECGFEGP